MTSYDIPAVLRIKPEAQIAGTEDHRPSRVVNGFGALEEHGMPHQVPETTWWFLIFFDQLDLTVFGMLCIFGLFWIFCVECSCFCQVFTG